MSPKRDGLKHRPSTRQRGAIPKRNFPPQDILTVLLALQSFDGLNEVKTLHPVRPLYSSQ